MNILEERDLARTVLAERSARDRGVEPIHEAVHADEKEAGKHNSLLQWSRTSSGKRMVSNGVIDLGVIKGVTTWGDPVNDLSLAMADVFEYHRKVTVIDSNGILREAHISTDQLTKRAVEELRWRAQKASDAAFEAGDEIEGEISSAVAHAMSTARIHTAARPSRLDHGAVWIFQLEPSIGSVRKKNGG